MGLKNRISKFSGKMTKEKWLLLLLIGSFDDPVISFAGQPEKG